MTSFVEFRAAAEGLRPSAAVVLGSGLARATPDYSPAAEVRFADVPGLAPAGVLGHAGTVSVGQWAGVPVLVFHGRLHFYEGHSWDVVTGTVRLAADLGVKRIVLTNAAGGIHPDLNPGDLMLLNGHIKLLEPLDWTDGGPMVARPYSEPLKVRKLLTGIYAALTGPCYETPAEIRALKAMGADAVGMSTAMEAETAQSLGMEVIGISCITNKAAGLAAAILSHEEVQVTGAAAAERLSELIGTILG